MTRTKERLDELEAHIWLIERRLDGLRDDIQELEVTLKPTYAMRYFWERFEDTLAWAQKYDKNSEEWKKLNKLGWTMMDKYLTALLKSPWGKTDAKGGRK